MRFLLDENMRAEIAEFLKRRGYDVLFVPKGLKNGEALALAERESRILITFDSDFENDLMYPPSKYHGMIRIRIHPPHVVKLTQALDNLMYRNFKVSVDSPLPFGERARVRGDAEATHNPHPNPLP